MQTGSKSAESHSDNKMKVGESIASQYLIIGGVPKSATTSLFYYLADHPQVCAANRKETYFFAREFDLAEVCNLNETTKAFESYFTHCDSLKKLRVEATPYTLYSEGAAKKIATLLPDSAILFVLRDPVERLLSDYYFHVQREHRSAQGSFDEFLEWQKWMRGNVPNLIEQGCYSKYLSSFFSFFGKNRVQVIFFEELVMDPVTELQGICEASGIDAEFFSNYNFDSHNKTMSIRYNWLNQVVKGYVEPFVSKLRTRLIKWPKLYGLLENSIGAGQLAYRTINDAGSEKKEPVSNELLAELADYYRPYNQALSKELDCQLPWKYLG